MRERLTYANAMSTIAVFIALGGSSYAAVQLNKNSVRSKHIKNGQIKRADLGRSAVDSTKVKDGALVARDFAAGQLPAGTPGAKGEKGEPGAAGPAGPTGPAGAVSQTRTRWSEPIAVTSHEGHSTSATAKCEAGETLLTGGSRLQPLPNHVAVVVDRPSRADDTAPAAGEAPSAWRVSVIRQAAGGPTELTAFAVCAT